MYVPAFLHGVCMLVCTCVSAFQCSHAWWESTRIFSNCQTVLQNDCIDLCFQGPVDSNTTASNSRHGLKTCANPKIMKCSVQGSLKFHFPWRLPGRLSCSSCIIGHLDFFCELPILFLPPSFRSWFICILVTGLFARVPYIFHTLTFPLLCVLAMSCPFWHV